MRRPRSQPTITTGVYAASSCGLARVRTQPAPGHAKAREWLVPADLSKREFGVLFKQVGTSLGHGPIMEKIHVFDRRARNKIRRLVSANVISI